MDKQLSFGAFSGDRLVGFILNSCSIYQGVKAVFDVGTGVIPEHRGNKVFTNLFKFAQQQLQEQGIERYYLEVLQQNDRAIHAYQKQGFSTEREFCVLNLTANLPQDPALQVTCVDLAAFDAHRFDDCTRVPPSYEHSDNLLRLHPELYSVAYRQQEQKLTAFCVFSKQDGRLIQLGYTTIDELRQVVRWLMSRYSRIVIKNIDKRCAEVLAMLHSLGAVEVAKQFEMVKELRAEKKE